MTPSSIMPLIWLTVLALLSVGPSAVAQTSPDQILLKDFRPHSIFKIPETHVEKARYPAFDMHSHNYTRTETEVDRWVATMDEVGLEMTVILSGDVGGNLPNQVLEKIYRGNAVKLFTPAPSNH